MIPNIEAVVDEAPVTDKLWIKLPDTMLAPVLPVKYNPNIPPANEEFELVRL